MSAAQLAAFLDALAAEQAEADQAEAERKAIRRDLKARGLL